MAVKLNKRQAAHTNSSIETGRLVKRLQRHALGATKSGGKDARGRTIKIDLMSISQVNAARILLNKTLPDQKQTDLNIDGELTIQVMNYAGRPDPE